MEKAGLSKVVLHAICYKSNKISNEVWLAKVFQGSVLFEVEGI